MSKQRVWMSFDLGVRGDYDGLYQWLDEKGAVECGNGVATFEYEFSDSAISMNSFEPIFDELKEDLKKQIDSIEQKGRIYALTMIGDKSKPAGVFLFGKRKASPWEGYANIGKPEVDV